MRLIVKFCFDLSRLYRKPCRCYPQRSRFYLTKYSQRLEGGAKYHQLKAVFGVHFLGYRLFPEHDSGKHCFEWRERHHPNLRLTDQMAWFVFELPKFNLEASEPLNQWLHFFNSEHKSEKPMHYTHPPVQKAYALLQQISADESVRQLADMRERALLNEVSMIADAKEEGIEEGMKKGREQGKEEGKILVARALLDMLDDETIGHSTELPIETLKKLRSNSGLMENV